ncbi:hypothetical protein COOONC_07390 [Cooperia oncophora]
MELYTMCDAVSAQVGGLPDSVLRPAMLHTLQRHLTEAQTAWMREHLQDLIKGWKQEVRRETFVDRPTLVQMKAAEYVPVAPSRKRFRGKNSAESRAGRVMMGVGALLEAQRQKMVTEEGELEVEEDEQGNIMLGGEALSFESWAKLTKTNQPDIVCARLPGDEPEAKKPKPEEHEFKKLKWVIIFPSVALFFLRSLSNIPPLTYMVFLIDKLCRQSQKEWKEKRMGAKKMRIMQQARDELEALNKETQTPYDVLGNVLSYI